MNKKGILRLNLNFRRMKEIDIPEIIALAKTTPSVAVSEKTRFWTEEELQGWITKSNDPLIIAETNGEIAGFILARIHHPTHNGIIENLMIKTKYQRKGIGARLLQQCLKQLKVQNVVFVYTLIHLEDINVIEFVRKNGFRQGYKFNWFEREL